MAAANTPSVYNISSVAGFQFSHNPYYLFSKDTTTDWGVASGTTSSAFLLQLPRPLAFTSVIMMGRVTSGTAIANEQFNTWKIKNHQMKPSIMTYIRVVYLKVYSSSFANTSPYPYWRFNGLTRTGSNPGLYKIIYFTQDGISTFSADGLIPTDILVIRIILVIVFISYWSNHFSYCLVIVTGSFWL